MIGFAFVYIFTMFYAFVVNRYNASFRPLLKNTSHNFELLPVRLSYTWLLITITIIRMQTMVKASIKNWDEQSSLWAMSVALGVGLWVYNRCSIL